MKESRAKDIGHHEEHGDSRVQGSVNDSKHLRLAQSACECETISNEIEFANLYLH